HPHPLLRVLSPGAHSPCARQGCPQRTTNRAPRTRPGHPDSRSRRPASSLRPARGLSLHQFTTPAPLCSGRSPSPIPTPPPFPRHPDGPDLPIARLPIIPVQPLLASPGSSSAEADEVLAKDSVLSHTVSTVKKSHARMLAAC